jgi:hypothetical protein
VRSERPAARVVDPRRPGRVEGAEDRSGEHPRAEIGRRETVPWLVGAATTPAGIVAVWVRRGQTVSPSAADGHPVGHSQFVRHVGKRLS